MSKPIIMSKELYVTIIPHSASVQTGIDDSFLTTEGGCSRCGVKLKNAFTAANNHQAEANRLAGVLARIANYTTPGTPRQSLARIRIMARAALKP